VPEPETVGVLLTSTWSSVKFCELLRATGACRSAIRRRLERVMHAGAMPNDSQQRPTHRGRIDRRVRLRLT
jgi:hypothetical protein